MDDEKTSDPVMHEFQEQNSSIFSVTLIIVLILVSIFGIGTGYLLSKNKGKIVANPLNIGGDSSSIAKGTVVGSDDLKTFKDLAEGDLKKGGIDDEGQYHLVRPGGESQNVYLTSSTLDLSSFLGKKVKVWGETQKAKKAGWLMDVGRLEVLE